MPDSLPSASELVARFLRANGYKETLSSFLKEAGLAPEAINSGNPSITIETILQEKKTFDVSINFEKLGIDEDDQGWTLQAPSKANIVGSLSNRSNIIFVSVFDLQLPTASRTQPYIVVTTADRQLQILDATSTEYPLICNYSGILDSPGLDIIMLDSTHILVATMSGKLVLFDLASGTVVDQRKDHSKYLVKLAVWPSGQTHMIASAGWDSKIFLYRLDVSSNVLQIGDPISTLELPSIPEAMTFVPSPEDGLPLLLVARRDSTFLHYYAIPSKEQPDFALLGKQNLAPHSNAWVAFTPADIQICPKDPYLAAVATSSTPHMKLIVVKLLLPPSRNSLTHAGTESDGTVGLTQASQARAELLIANREEAAILVNVSTLAPQTSYSTPRVVWRPDGSGVYVSSDDGIIRGLEAKTGKPIASLRGHEAGSKLRCLWAGYLQGIQSASTISTANGTREYLISGGFDQKLIIWTSD